METKRFCSQCGTELTPGAKFCRNCGAPVKNAEPAAPAVQNRPVQTASQQSAVPPRPQQMAQSNYNRGVQGSEEQKFPIAILIGAIVGFILIVLVAVIVLYKKDVIKLPFLEKIFSSEESEDDEIEDALEEAAEEGDSSIRDKIGNLFEKKEDGDSSSPAASDDQIAKADALVEASYEKVVDDDLRADAMQKLTEAMAIYKQAGPDKGSAGAAKAFEYYVKGTQKQVDMLMTLDVAADIYAEIENTIDDAIVCGEDLQNAGLNVNMDNIRQLRDNIEDKYKALFIEKFDEFINEYEWNVRHNEEFMRGAVEAFPSDDPDDPIRLRYAYARAWLVRQEINEGLADGSIDEEDAVKRVAEEAESCDYAEFLLQDAEVWAVTANQKAGKAAYDASFNLGHYCGGAFYAPIIEDSSTKEYSVDDIGTFNLSPQELHAARLEIYARHNFDFWSPTYEKLFGYKDGINPYKFMSYNDFGNYSKDNKNGLTKTERHNIRAIGEYEMDHIKEGYFGLEYDPNKKYDRVDNRLQKNR
ncbi:MAG: zinc-ribbon domain-containing protein [Lachnospiraceae bacterium]|nr:zinc-ribbon domain-containing protein [Lachnospiraceae bacterium]